MQQLQRSILVIIDAATLGLCRFLHGREQRQLLHRRAHAVTLAL